MFKIYIFDETDKIWEVKGSYVQVVKDNDEVQFTPHDKYGHFLRILVVSNTVFLLCVLSSFKHFTILLDRLLGATRLPQRCGHQSLFT